MAFHDAAVWGLTDGNSVTGLPEDLREPALKTQTHSPAVRGGGRGSAYWPVPLESAVSGDIGNSVCFDYTFWLAEDEIGLYYHNRGISG